MLAIAQEKALKSANFARLRKAAKTGRREKGLVFATGVEKVVTSLTNSILRGPDTMHINQYMPRQSAFSLLFSRYLNGDITERAWARLMHTFDGEGLSATERRAFARFMSEMIDEAGKGRLNVPSSEELKEILSDMRATKN